MSFLAAPTRSALFDASCLGLAIGCARTEEPPDVPLRVLVFSQTEAFRHLSIPPAVTAMERMGETQGWENFIRTGGGYIGVHSASDTEYEPFLTHVQAGLEWAAGRIEGDCETGRGGVFEKQVLDSNTTSPMKLEVADDGRGWFIERFGALKVHDPNTGATSLPPASQAWLWYPYGVADDHPELGPSLGRMAVVGPRYRSGGFAALPSYYDGALLIADWMNEWIKVVKLDDAGEVLDIHEVATSLSLLKPMAIDVGPDGRLYFIEFGTLWGPNDEAQIARLEYRGPPQ